MNNREKDFLELATEALGAVLPTAVVESIIEIHPQGATVREMLPILHQGGINVRNISIEVDLEKLCCKLVSGALAKEASMFPLTGGFLIKKLQDRHKYPA